MCAGNQDTYTILWTVVPEIKPVYRLQFLKQNLSGNIAEFLLINWMTRSRRRTSRQSFGHCKWHIGRRQRRLLKDLWLWRTNSTLHALATKVRNITDQEVCSLGNVRFNNWNKLNKKNVDEAMGQLQDYRGWLASLPCTVTQQAQARWTCAIPTSGSQLQINIVERQENGHVLLERSEQHSSPTYFTSMSWSTKISTWNCEVSKVAGNRIVECFHYRSSSPRCGM